MKFRDSDTSYEAEIGRLREIFAEAVARLDSAIEVGAIPAKTTPYDKVRLEYERWRHLREFGVWLGTRLRKTATARSVVGAALQRVTVRRSVRAESMVFKQFLQVLNAGNGTSGHNGVAVFVDLHGQQKEQRSLTA